jgi:DNA repair exonuclease SbcCD ATPase subunit
VALFGRRRREPLSLEGERERLHAVRRAAEEELGRLRRELVERVAAVEARERELADALARLRRGGAHEPREGVEDALAHAEIGLAARAQELDRREAALAERERALVREEARLARAAPGAAIDPDERLARIEARLAALQEAERAFARTQAELAARSDELARREAALEERERALEGGGAGLGRAELAELEERLRRLERETREAAAERSFGDGLRTLQRKGLRRSPPNA